jgi:hypothetical protein
MRVAILALALALALAGCATKHSSDICSRYGFKPGTDAFAACGQKEALAAEQRSQETLKSIPDNVLSGPIK